MMHCLIGFSARSTIEPRKQVFLFFFFQSASRAKTVDMTAPLLRKAHNFFVGKHEGNRPLGRPRRRWEGIVKTCLKK
jgi:hypothetical protein